MQTNNDTINSAWKARGWSALGLIAAAALPAGAQMGQGSGAGYLGSDQALVRAHNEQGRTLAGDTGTVGTGGTGSGADSARRGAGGGTGMGGGGGGGDDGGGKITTGGGGGGGTGQAGGGLIDGVVDALEHINSDLDARRNGGDASFIVGSTQRLASDDRLWSQDVGRIGSGGGKTLSLNGGSPVPGPATSMGILGGALAVIRRRRPTPAA